MSRWIAEKPGVSRDEFIDDIPYPETQNYVKRILGTAEDYRRLYSEGGGPPGARCAAAPRRWPATKKKATAPTRKSPPRLIHLAETRICAICVICG